MGRRQIRWSLWFKTLDFWDRGLNLLTNDYLHPLIWERQGTSWGYTNKSINLNCFYNCWSDNLVPVLRGEGIRSQVEGEGGEMAGKNLLCGLGSGRASQSVKRAREPHMSGDPG